MVREAVLLVAGGSHLDVSEFARHSGAVLGCGAPVKLVAGGEEGGAYAVGGECWAAV